MTRSGFAGVARCTGGRCDVRRRLASVRWTGSWGQRRVTAGQRAVGHVVAVTTPPARRAAALGAVTKDAAPVASGRTARRLEVTPWATTGTHPLHPPRLAHYVVARDVDNVGCCLRSLYAEDHRAGKAVGRLLVGRFGKAENLAVHPEHRLDGVVRDIWRKSKYRHIYDMWAHLFQRDSEVV